MDKEFLIEGTIATLRKAVPIRFAHHKSMDRQENHVLHLNNYLEVFVFVRGNHKYIVGDQIYQLRRGDVVLINPLQVHKALPVEPCLYERFYLLIDEHCFDALAVNPLISILNDMNHSEAVISLLPEEREQVLELLYEISDCFQKEEHCQLKAMSLVLQLLEICARQRTQKLSVVGETAHVPELLERILCYVAENTASIQSITSIAQELGISPQYLSAYFSKQIGTPLAAYIQTKKIALAKSLLEKGADVTEACFDSGFNDCSYFIRVFKKHVGITPLRFRQTLNTSK